MMNCKKGTNNKIYGVARFAPLVFIILMHLPCVANPYAKMSKYLVNLTHIQTSAKARGTAIYQQPTISALMKMSGNYDVKDITRSHDCYLLDSIGDIYIINIPINQLIELANDVRVERIEAHEMPIPTMDETPQRLGADKAWAGTNLTQAFAGKGVIAGLVDGGFDFTHLMFLDSTGHTRIAYYYDMTDAEENGINGRGYNPNELMELKHSAITNTQHGTRVASVMAGSKVYSKSGHSYCGIAPESTIVLAEIPAQIRIDEHAKVTGGDLTKNTNGTTANFILAIKRIFDYAEAVGQPCVVNLSLGFHLSITDPCILENEALSQLVGPGRIIVAGAGNDGQSYATMTKAANKGVVVACFDGTSYADTTSTMSQAQVIDCYLLTEYSQKVSIILGPDSIEKTIIVDTSVLDNLKGDTCYFDAISHPDSSGIVYVEAFKIVDVPSYINGNLYQFSIEVSPNDGSTLSSWLYNHFHLWKSPQGQYYKIGDGIRVAISSDSPCEMYTNPIFTPYIHALQADKLSDCINNTHTIAWPAESPSVISVGSVTSRFVFSSEYPKDRIAPFSSLGPSWGNHLKPEVVAPGVNIATAHNSFGPNDFLNKHDWVYDNWGNKSEIHVFHGTSISSPMMAGTIALWLQAKPNLTPDEIKETLSKTCSRPDETLDYPNNTYGYGEVNTYAGLLHILGIPERIDELSMQQPSGIKIKIVNKQLQVIDEMSGLPYLGKYEITVFSTNGNKMVSSKNSTIDLSFLHNGIYAIQINTGKKESTGSTLIRLE